MAQRGREGIHSGLLLILFWLLSTLAVAFGAQSLRLGRRHLRAVAAGMKAQPNAWAPPVTLIVPVKGREPGLGENLRSLLDQDYPDYEVLVAAREGRDPALAELPAAPGRAVRVITAGEEPADTGEKIRNLLAAVAQARPASQVLAFADSDGRVERDWLRALVSPLADPAVGAATGYRWYFPEQGGFWPLMRSVWNSTIAGTFGTGAAPFAWGGAMALRHETFVAARVAQFWRGAVSDDYRLSQAVRQAGLRIQYVPRAMVASSGQGGAAEFFSWARRQMIITRVYAPRLWWMGFAAHWIYCGAMAAGAAVLAEGKWWALPVLLAGVLPGMWRGTWRGRAARILFPGRAAWLDRHRGIYCWLALPTTWIWLAVFAASSWRRRIRWRHRVYELRGPSQTRVLS